MSVEFKKLRVMWNESLNSGNGEDVNFLCSFDSGNRWHSFADVLAAVRDPSSSDITIPYATYQSVDNDYTAIDFTIPLVFDAIPGISDDNSSVTAYDDSSTNGLPAGEYYIKVASISAPYVGLTETSTPLSAMSTPSVAKKFTLPTRGDIELGVRYDELTKGLAVYIGKETTMNLQATVEASSTSVVSFTKYTVDGYTSEIPVEFGTIYGSSFAGSLADDSTITQSEGELDITEDMIESFSITQGNKIVLSLNGVTLTTGDTVSVNINVIHYRLLFISNLATSLVKAIDSYDSDAIYLDKRYPLPFSGTVKIDSEEITYTSCTFASDSDFPNGYYVLSGLSRGAPASTHKVGSAVFLALLDGGNWGELPRKTISIYQDSDNLVQYFNFESSAYSDTVVDLTKNNNAHVVGTIDSAEADSFLKNSISFNKGGVLVTEQEILQNGTIHFYFKIDSLPNADMTLFGSETGMRLKLHKDNLRLSVEFGDDTVISNENPKLSKVQVGKWTEVALTWQYSSTYGTNRVYLYKDGILEHDVSYGFGTGTYQIALGGSLVSVEDDYSDAEYNNPYLGRMDDWRVYSTCLSLDELTSVDSNLKEYGYDYCGTLTLGKQFASGSSVLDYYLYDGQLQKYEPYIATYFSVLSADADTVDENSEYGSTTDMPLLAAVENGNYYTNDMILSFYESSDDKYGYCIIKSDGTAIPRVNYPTDIDSIKYRFELTGSSDGISSPIVKDFATIVSTSSVDF